MDHPILQVVVEQVETILLDIRRYHMTIIILILTLTIHPLITLITSHQMDQLPLSLSIHTHRMQLPLLS